MNLWTAEDLQTLRVHYAKVADLLVLAGLLGGRHTCGAIKTMAQKLRLRRPPRKRNALGRTW